MGREKRPSKPEEEYQFGEEDFTEGFEVPEEAASAEIKPKRAFGFADALKKYRLLVVLLILIVAIGVLRIVTTGDKTAEKTQETQTAAVPTITQPQAVSADVAAQRKQQALDSLFKEDVDALAQKTTVEASAITQLQNQVSTLTAAVNRSNQTLTSLQTALSAMTTELQALKAKQAQMAKPTKVVAVKRPAAPKITYTVRAVVPGRAWLQSSQGQTRSVAVGDVVPGYGKVTRINAEQGLVMLSSGARFGYGEHDS